MMMFMKRVVHSIDFAAFLLVAWGAAIVLPLNSFWFEPGEIVVSDTDTNTPATIVFTREIKRPVTMSYGVVVRDVDESRVICEARSGSIRYHPLAKLPKKIDMEWWAPGDQRCGAIYPPGNYIMETCWKAQELFLGLVGTKTICRSSNIFKVSEPV